MGNLNLDEIRKKLIRIEDSIILALFERSRYKTNKIIYSKQRIKIPNFRGSFFGFLLKGTEELHAKAGRYNNPEEHPFFERLPQQIIPRKIKKSPLTSNINLNKKILKMYMEALNKFCEKGDDKEYGSTAICDINALQQISARVHLGLFVAEAKFREDPEGYMKLIANKNTKAIKEKLRNLKVEKAVLERVKEKAKRYNLNPKFIMEFYKNKIIPLTIESQIKYFQNKAN